ncbi:trehalase-like domain-containing protein [Glutamicibacter sp. BW77]|uniref:trehalase-like domain-containing protein n=1 Tax=Glutamicibacter TaxID=1742989 RepID=UPI0031BB12F0
MESSEPGTRSTPLEDYALLSDLRTGPLVSRDGSIDWLCFPRFDSPSVFAALIGTEDDGRWRLWAPGGQVVSRRYLPRTFVLETIWRTKTGTAQVLDFLPPRSQQADVLRKVSVLEGQVNIAHDLRIRFDYNRSKPWTRKITLGDGTTTGLLSVAGPDALLLTGPQLHPDVPENEESEFLGRTSWPQPARRLQRCSLRQPHRRIHADCRRVPDLGIKLVPVPSSGSDTAGSRRSLGKDH